MELFLAIAFGIFVGMIGFSAVWMTIVMNKRFMKMIVKTSVELTNEMMDEIRNKTEEACEQIRWTENI